jgi:hypothetical protein
MSEARIAKAGKLLSVESGTYSDYHVTGFFVVLRDFDPMAELTEFLDANPGQRESYGFDGDEFLAALLSKGLLLEIEYGTLHMGDYSSSVEVRFTPVED